METFLKEIPVGRHLEEYMEIFLVESLGKFLRDLWGQSWDNLQKHS